MINDITGRKVHKNYNIDKLIQNDGQLLEDSTSICNQFNSIFVNVGKDIDNNIIMNDFDKIDRKELNM